MQTIIFFFSSSKWTLNESSTLLEIVLVIKQISKHFEKKTNMLGKKEK